MDTCLPGVLSREKNLIFTNNTVLPRVDAAATNFFPLLKLVATIRGQRLLEGGDKNFHSSRTAYKNNEKVCSKFNT